MMVETKGVQRESLGAAARLLACRYTAFEMIYLMYHLFAINSISFSYIHRLAYRAILRAQARPPGTLRWERPGRIWWRLQQSQPEEYWQRVLGVHPGRSPREKWCRSGDSLQAPPATESQFSGITRASPRRTRPNRCPNAPTSATALPVRRCGSPKRGGIEELITTAMQAAWASTLSLSARVENVGYLTRTK